MKEDFFQLAQKEALTFDDILILPGYSEILPAQISTQISLTDNLVLNTPIISAAMDTVTEHKMAQVMAQYGGFGVIHKNMSVKSQCYEVQKVKKYESGMILDPITLSPETPVYKALELMKKHSISGVPITKNNQLEGILTNRDLRFETKMDQPVSSIMTPKEKLVTAKEGINLEQAKEVLHKHRIEKLPVMDEKGFLKGLITIKDIEKAMAFPHATKDPHGRLFVGAAVGTGSEEKHRAESLIRAEVDLLCVDTAHGLSKNVIEMAAFLKTRYSGIVLMVGNVATEKGAVALADAGADIIKVGMGPGSICTTRVVSGVGVPQVNAILNCAKALKKKGKTLVADGGLKHSGDLTKAIALGAQAAMVGNILAGSDESPGEIVLYRGRAYKAYRGMGSLGAMKKGSKDRYRQENVFVSDKIVPEGVEGRVPYRGSASHILYQMAGGLKAGMGYIGAKNINDFQKKSNFIKVSSKSFSESHIHDVSITKEAPNYRLE
ncbi:MAG: IMP dehydrogenase [Bdellovibrionales bacterium]|nr:IMP dehydrogenase [Bdellovibrionales bacterium]